QLGTKCADATFLERPQPADERQHRGLARPGRPGVDHDFSRKDVGRDVEQNLLAQRARPEMVIDVPDLDSSFHSWSPSWQIEILCEVVGEPTDGASEAELRKVVCEDTVDVVELRCRQRLL